MVSERTRLRLRAAQAIANLARPSLRFLMGRASDHNFLQRPSEEPKQAAAAPTSAIIRARVPASDSSHREPLDRVGNLNRQLHRLFLSVFGATIALRRASSRAPTSAAESGGGPNRRSPLQSPIPWGFDGRQAIGHPRDHRECGSSRGQRAAKVLLSPIAR
jgi:hypothetical protein